MIDQPSRDEWEFAETAWEVTREMVDEGDPYGRHIWNILQKYYPGNKRKQIRVLGLLNEIHGREGIPMET